MKTKKKVPFSLRIDADTKEKSEQIFENMGINMTTAINLFLKQTVNDDALPFRPHQGMTPQQADIILDSELNRGVNDIKNHRVMTGDQFDQLTAELNQKVNGD